MEDTFYLSLVMYHAFNFLTLLIIVLTHLKLSISPQSYTSIRVESPNLCRCCYVIEFVQQPVKHLLKQTIAKLDCDQEHNSFLSKSKQTLKKDLGQRLLKVSRSLKKLLSIQFAPKASKRPLTQHQGSELCYPTSCGLTIVAQP